MSVEQDAIRDCSLRLGKSIDDAILSLILGLYDPALISVRGEGLKTYVRYAGTIMYSFEIVVPGTDWNAHWWVRS